MALLYGLGSPDFLTSGLNPERLLPVEPMEFEIAGESDSIESKKFVDGKLVTAGAAQTSETYTMKIGIEAIDWLAMQFAYGELAGTTASVALPELKYATIPASAPYEIVDANITTTNAWATFVNGKPLTKVGAAPAATGEFQPVTASTKLVFHSSDASKSIAYRTFKTYTNLESIGVEAVYTAFSSFQFSGVAYADGEKYKIVMPKITKVGIPTLSITGDVSKFELEFKMIVQAGERRAFKLYKLPAE